MSELRRAFIAAAASASTDSFGRWRVSEPYTIFDCKQIFDAQPLFFDDQEVSGAGTSTSHSTAEARTRIGVSSSTAGHRVRQTFQWFNYQPGKSQLVMMTWANMGSVSGVTKRAGLFYETNGLFFQCKDGVMAVGRRSGVSGGAVDEIVTQTNWNVDKMDGQGPSGVTLDKTKAQIGFIDYEWLGVGSARMGFVIGGAVCYVHQFNNANVLSTVYMSLPNLPVRFEIINDGTGGADTFDHICVTVNSEGGRQELGQLRYASNGNTFINANTAGVIYALVALRLKSTHQATTVLINSVNSLSVSADDFEWLLLLNPTFAAAVTYADETNSSLQSAPGNVGNPSTSTLTNGYKLAGGYVKASVNTGSVDIPISNAIKLGSNIANVPDVLCLAVRPLGANADVYGGITWRELQ